MLYCLLTNKNLSININLIPFIHFTLPHFPLVTTILFVSMSLFLFCYICLFVTFLFYILGMSEIIWFLSFSI